MKSGDQGYRHGPESGDSASANREGASFLLKAYESFVPDFVRKTVLLGLGSVSMTEESVRRLLADLRLPREEAKRLYDYLVEQSQKSKSEVLNLVGSEVKGFLKTLNLEHELQRILAGMRIRIQADITFEARDGSAPPSRFDVSVQQVDAGPPAEPPQDASGRPS